MTEALDREDLLDAIVGFEGDLHAFRRAMDALSDRKQELSANPDRQKLFLEWPATQALLNVLIMAITRCEGLIEDHRKILESLDIPDNLILLEKNHAE